MKINKPIIIALLLAANHGLTLAQKAVRGICDGHPGCPKSGIANQQNNTNSNSSAERAQQVLKAIGAIGAAMDRSAESAAENERVNTTRQQLTNNTSQPGACPASIMAGGGPYDLAGAIKQAGSPKAVLSAYEQALREMSEDCSIYADAEVCRVTKAVSRDVVAALKKCIAAGANSVAAGSGGPEPRTREECNSRYTDDQKIACWERIDRQNLADANAAFDAIKSQASPVTEKNPWTPAPFKPLDPKRDYSGESCSYFTKPAREGDYRLNYYADDSFVCYGTKMYKCVIGRWESKGPCSAYQNSGEHRAEKLESSDLNTKVYEE